MSIPSFSNLKGTGYTAINLPIGDERQRSILSNLIGGLEPNMQGALGQLGQFASGGSPEMWQQLEAPAMRQFGALQGSLASRFSGMGSGARRSSGFQNTMGGAATDLSERLQSQRLNIQRNAISELLNYGKQLLTTPMSQTYLTPEKTPFWQEMILSLMQNGGRAAGHALGYGTGGMA